MTTRPNDRSRRGPRAGAHASDDSAPQPQPQPVGSSTARAIADASDEAPPRLERGAGYPGRAALGNADNQLRRSLARLARDPDPGARRAGAQLAQEATAALSALADRAERASTAWKRAQARAEQLTAKLDQQLADARRTVR
jgi:hypothetical protein